MATALAGCGPQLARSLGSRTSAAKASRQHQKNVLPARLGQINRRSETARHGANTRLAAEPEFQLSGHQLAEFEALEDVMQRYSLWVSFACVVGIASLIDSASALHNISPGRLAHTLLRFCTALLVLQASKVLPRPSAPPERQLPRLMAWLRTMSMAFSQMAALSVLAATVAAMEAARIWPDLVVTWSVALSIFAMSRFLVLQYLTHKYPDGGIMDALSQLQHDGGADIPWADRAALILISGTTILCYDLPASAGSTEQGSDPVPGSRDPAAAVQAVIPSIIKKESDVDMECRDDTPESATSSADEGPTPAVAGDWASTITGSLGRSAQKAPGAGEEGSDGAGGQAASSGAGPSDSGAGGVEAPEDDEPEFEFTRNHERSFVIFMDSMRSMATWTAAWAVASCMMAAAQIAAHGARSPGWLLSALDVFEGGSQAVLILFAVGCFSRIVSTEGRDLHLLMDGISSRRGVTALFERLTNVQRVTGLIGLVTLVVPKVLTTERAVAILTYIKLNGVAQLAQKLAGS